MFNCFASIFVDLFSFRLTMILEFRLAIWLPLYGYALEILSAQWLSLFIQNRKIADADEHLVSSFARQLVSDSRFNEIGLHLTQHLIKQSLNMHFPY